MDKSELVLVFDCGSTNLRAAAVNPQGDILAQANCRNGPVRQPGGRPDWMIWDIDDIWSKLCGLSREVTKRVGSSSIKAVIVTTWGADGAPVKKDGALTYPVISWQCSRTREVIEELTSRISPWEIFRITGYQVISFNTLFKLLWLKKREPKALEEAYTWLMMPGLIVHRLTGEFHIDPTIASTMMAMDMGRRDWSVEMLEQVGLDPNFFPEWKEPGEIVGYVRGDVADRCGLRANTPVVVGGEDTQYSFISSKSEPYEAVLSSGTWEILGIRIDKYDPNEYAFRNGLTIEADVLRGFWIPQILMIGSAVLEWIRKLLFTEVSSYESMVEEGRKIPVGSDGVVLIPSFVSDTGPTRRYGTKGTLLGLNLRISRGHIYRAALEGLSYQLRQALQILSKATGIQVERIKVVGGGSKNELWNQIRANVTKTPVTASLRSEATVVGAALMAFIGIDYYKSLEDAWKSMEKKEKHYLPIEVESKKYDEIFTKYIKLPPLLKDFYI